MDRTEIVERMRTKAVELLDVTAEAFVETASLKDDLEVDSLDIVEYVMALEDEFAVELPEEELTGARTISDLVDVVVAKTAEAA